jgi:hypothetical protein
MSDMSEPDDGGAIFAVIWVMIAVGIALCCAYLATVPAG